MRNTPSYRTFLLLCMLALTPSLSWPQSTAKQTLGELMQLENQKLLNKSRVELQRQSELVPQQLGLPIEVGSSETTRAQGALKKIATWKVLGVYGLSEPLSVLMAYGEKQHELIMGVKTIIGANSIRVMRLEHQCVVVEINKGQQRFCLH